MAPSLSLVRRQWTLAARLLARAFPAAGVVGLWVLFARPGGPALPSPGWPQVLTISALLAGAVVATVRRFRRAAVGAPVLLVDEIAFGSALVALAFAVVSVAEVHLYPLVYLVMAFLVAFQSRPAALAVLGVALAFELAGLSRGRVADVGARAVFLVLFAGLYHVVLALRIELARQAEADAVKKKLREVEEQARTFRLVASGTDRPLGIDDDEQWLVAAVSEIQGATGSVLEIAELALGAHTAAAFLLSADDRSLKLHDCRSSSEHVQRDRFSAQEGILAALLKKGAPVRMAAPAGLKGVTYYEPSHGPKLGALIATPILERHGRCRGVLVADRVDGPPFTEADERLMEILAGELFRSIEVERVMHYIRSSRDEKDRFFRALEELNRAGAPDQVFRAVVESARQVAAIDFGAVTLVSDEPKGRTHRISRLWGVPAAAGKALEGTSFPDNSGLVSTVVRYGTPLPGRDAGQMDRQVIFDPDTVVRGLRSLKIFPLKVQDRILGTLVAGSRRQAALDADEVRMLEVIAMQAAQAVLRAQLFEQMERMATTDGLTGLFNHRTFQARFDEALAAARRYRRTLSFLLTDIDHFKSVNDTYGHPTGDLVLKGVARILKDEARDTDVVARYGGEEFAIVMPETDARGALVIAERIRERIQREVFATDQGPLKITLSLGIATFPESAGEKQPLIDLADQCLYFAKRNGRNRSVTTAQLTPASRAS